MSRGSASAKTALKVYIRRSMFVHFANCESGAISAMHARPESSLKVSATALRNIDSGAELIHAVSKREEDKIEGG